MTDNIGQRQLAAIVFTDVADFSSKAGADEERTIRRVREDLELLEGLSAGHNGRIVKTTGDGLLISFSSAVDAVSFAIEGQRRVVAQNETLSPAERLEHRMGIHLGDIFLTESDAMGDGVNIAARLQSEAEPGGICISQTVYDVIKNKLSITAVSLGAKDLKNIRDAIYAYSIVVDAESKLATTAVGGVTAPSTRRRGAKYWIIAAVVVLAIAGALVVRARRRRFLEALEHAQREIAAPAEEPFPGDRRLPAIQRIMPQLERYGRENPLMVRLPPIPGARGPGARPREVPLWMEGGDILFRINGEVRRRRPEQLQPTFLAAIRAGLVREARGGRLTNPPSAP